MSKFEKLLDRLLKIPKDFTWDELSSLLSYLGYQKIKTGKTGGSRRKFIDGDKNIIILHKPHPDNVIKTYALNK